MDVDMHDTYTLSLVSGYVVKFEFHMDEITNPFPELLA